VKEEIPFFFVVFLIPAGVALFILVAVLAALMSITFREL